MSKKILYGEEAKRALKKGIDQVANAVKITIGPKGRNVVLDKGYGAPTITNDGVSIANAITLKDKFENMGAEIAKEVASKTNEIAGDGTTTSIVLTQALVDEGMKHTVMGINAITLKNSIESACRDVVEALKGLSKPIKSKDEIWQVATISAESPEVGKIIADTINKVGKDGVVTVEESQIAGVESEIVEGMEFDKGYISPYLITDKERLEAVYNNPLILVTDSNITNLEEILPVIQKVLESSRKELVIIAEDCQGQALAGVIVNRLQGRFNTLVVRSPGYGDNKREMLQDIATVIGANFISEDLGRKLDTVEIADLGTASKIISTKDKTIIVNGRGNKKNIEARINQVKAQKEVTTSAFDLEKLDQRIARMSGGVAVIRVGGSTETEMKYLKLKVEDAVNATKAAIDEGIVAGGGSALIKAGEVVRQGMGKKMTEENKLGYSIVLRALEAPLRQIAINSGKDDGSVIVEKVKQIENDGYDAFNDVIVKDMVKVGIVDPVKVTRTALENACSAVAILLTTEVAITDEVEERNDKIQ